MSTILSANQRIQFPNASLKVHRRSFRMLYAPREGHLGLTRLFQLKQISNIRIITIFGNNDNLADRRWISDNKH